VVVAVAVTSATHTAGAQGWAGASHDAIAGASGGCPEVGGALGTRLSRGGGDGDAVELRWGAVVGESEMEEEGDLSWLLYIIALACFCP